MNWFQGEVLDQQNPATVVWSSHDCRSFEEARDYAESALQSQFHQSTVYMFSGDCGKPRYCVRIRLSENWYTVWDSITDQLKKA